MSLDPSALLAELQADPKHLGYKGQSTAGMAALLNQVGLSGETCPNTAAAIDGLILAIDPGEWGALSQAARDLLLRVSNLASVNLADARVRARISEIFPASGPTVTALAALAVRSCSRAEALWGAGTELVETDIIAALALAGGVLA